MAFIELHITGFKAILRHIVILLLLKTNVHYTKHSILVWHKVLFRVLNYMCFMQVMAFLLLIVSNMFYMLMTQL